MASDISPLFVANWKMNMLQRDAKRFAEDFLEQIEPKVDGPADIGIAPPFTALQTVAECFADIPGVSVGAQNVHWLEDGAHTGEVSVAMIRELGANFAIIGHSERREFYGETSSNVSKRAKAAIEHGLTALVCIGETEEEFKEGRTEEIVDLLLANSLEGLTDRDAANLVLGYEPIWAIGTGLAATPETADKVHNHIRIVLQQLFGVERGSAVPILYGGSTKPENVGDLLCLKNVNGALVGGASLKPDVFAALIKAGRNAN